MSEVRLVVREIDHDWSGTMHGACAERALAALSADPLTLDELEIAVRRFAKTDPNRRYFGNLSPGLRDEPHDAGLVVLDLVARLVVEDSTYARSGRKGGVPYHDGQQVTETILRYHLAEDWLFTRDRHDWHALAERRRRERAARPLLDARAVFYGEPMLEFVARECFAAFAGVKDSPTIAVSAQARYASPYANEIRRIHAAWLLTPREDLGGRCPREIALERRGHLSADLEDRCRDWSLLERCPPGLAQSSHAYLHGGFGSHESIIYYEVVRELLWSCCNQLQAWRDGPTSVADFLPGEVARLAIVRDDWLDGPYLDYHGRTPRSIIDRERARLPEGMSGAEALHDPDCPCCEMLRDMPGPMFWHLDGCNMDYDFAFDLYHRTREEWEQEQRDREEFSKRWQAEQAERNRQSGGEPLWTSSFSPDSDVAVPLEIRVFGLGCHLGELVTRLRNPGGATSADRQQLIDQLNRDFGNFRDVLLSSDAERGEALLEPVRNRFLETLDTVATVAPAQEARCAWFANALDKLLEAPRREVNENDLDDDLPF